MTVVRHERTRSDHLSGVIHWQPLSVKLYWVNIALAGTWLTTSAIIGDNLLWLIRQILSQLLVIIWTDWSGRYYSSYWW